MKILGNSYQEKEPIPTELAKIKNDLIMESIINKNLFDVGAAINKEIEFINNSGYMITSIELNENTVNYLKSYNTYGFKNIKTVINNNLRDSEIKVNRKKDKNAGYIKIK